VLGDLGLWIPQVPVEFMMEHILPPIHCNLNTVKSELERSGRILGERWAAFDEDPTKSGFNENNTFKALESIFVEIIRYAGRGETEGDIGGGDEGSGGETGEGASSDGGGNGGEAGEGTSGGDDGNGNKPGDNKNHHATSIFAYHNNPDRAPYSERHSGSRPDGYFIRQISGAHVKPHGKSKAVVHKWDDITVPAEFKKHNTRADVADVSLSLIDKS
jgi:hypothetical protein